jgi:hypothetical protein
MKATTRDREQGPASRLLAMAVVGLALACAGCSGLMPKLEAPQLSLVGIKIQDMTFFEQRLLVRLRVRPARRLLKESARGPSRCPPSARRSST